jgi:hypothetical protein
MADEEKPNARATASGGGTAKDATDSGADKPEAAKSTNDPKTSAKSSPPPAAAASAASAASASGASASSAPSGEIEKAAWGAPLAKLDRGWTLLESRLCAGVLVAEVVTLVFWIGIRALSATGRGGPGMIFRALLMAVLFGVVVHKVTKKHERHELFTTAAALSGLVIGTQLGDTGTAYFSNLFGWMQNSSILVFFGGVNELAKRFTLWLALLGASLATAQGKHINVDVVMRFLSPKGRVWVAVIGWVAAAIVSISASWGFFDYVCVEELRAAPTIACADDGTLVSGSRGSAEGGTRDATKRCPAPPGSKIDKLLASSNRNFFLARRQISLDLRSFPKVITGTPYNKWLTPREWNEWLRDGDWGSHFKAEDWKPFELPEDGTIDYRNPSVTAIPGGTEAIPKILVPLLNLVFAFGLLVIGLRFLLRSLLAISGWVKVDPAAAHGDEELAHAHDQLGESKS